MGLHSYQLMGIPGYQTLFVAPRYSGNTYPIPEGCRLITLPFHNEPRPPCDHLLQVMKHTSRRLTSIIRFTISAIRRSSHFDVDLVHIHSPMYLLIAMYFHALRRKACITFHGTDFHRIRRSSAYLRCAGIFDAVFCVSSDMKSDLEEIHQKPVRVVGNGVDLGLFRDLSVPRRKQLIAVGTLKEEKGFSCLIEAFRLLQQKSKPAREYILIVVGDGALRKQLERQIIGCGLQEKVFLCGEKEVHELIDLYNESEVFVLSSISEGFPKVVLEAMSCGCRIVATKVGEVTNVLGNDYPFLAEPCSAASLSGALQRILEGMTNRYDYSGLLQKSYTWDAVRARYGEVYADVFVHERV